MILKYNDHGTQCQQRCCSNTQIIYKMFSSIPTEILQNVFDTLSITDCKSIVDAHYEYNMQHARMKTIYDERISLTRYFNLNFINGSNMMRIMAESDTYLLGSRVMEFFTPNSIDEYSDWNFHSSSHPRSRYHFMKSMEDNGVVWKTAAQTFFDRMSDGYITIVMTREEFDTIYGQSKSMSLSDTQKSILKRMNNAVSQVRHSIFRQILSFGGHSHDGLFHCVDITDQHIESEFIKLSVIGGSIELKGKKIPITLSFCNDNSYGHIDMMHDVCFSIEQCFISGFGALHMYSRLASRGISYKWERTEFLSDESNRLETDQIAHKHTLRGYQIQCRKYTRNTYINQRNHCDDEAMIIKHPNDLEWNESYWTMAHKLSCQLQWCEHGFQTSHQKLRLSSLLSREFMCEYKRFRLSQCKDVDDSYLMKYAML